MADNPLYKVYKPQQIQFLPIESDETPGMYQLAIYGWPFTNLQFYKNGAEYDEITATKLLTKLEEDFLDKAIFNPKDWAPDPNITALSQFNDTATGGNIIKDAINVFTNKYSRATEETLKKYGKYQATTIKIVRNPVDAPIRKVIDNITSGKTFNYQTAGYDYLFHLYMIIEAKYMGDTIYLLTEKRPNIIWEKRKDFGTGDEKTSHYIKLAIQKDPKSYTIADAINYAKNTMGADFNRYDAATNNCQDYILALVHGLGHPGTADEFIKQPVGDLIQELGPNIVKGAKAVTDLAHFFGRLTGNGIRKQRIAKAESGLRKKPIALKLPQRYENTYPLGATVDKFIKKYGNEPIEKITIVHGQYNEQTQKFITPSQFNRIITERSPTAVIINVVAIEFELENGIHIITKKRNRGGIDFAFGKLTGTHALTIDIPNDFVLREAVRGSKAGMTNQEYIKNILNNLHLTEYYSYVDKAPLEEYTPELNYEYDAIRKKSKYDLEQADKKIAEQLIKGKKPDPLVYENTIGKNVVIDPFSVLKTTRDGKPLDERDREVDYSIPKYLRDSLAASLRGDLAKRQAEEMRIAAEQRAAAARTIVEQPKPIQRAARRTRAELQQLAADWRAANPDERYTRARAAEARKEAIKRQQSEAVQNAIAAVEDEPGVTDVSALEDGPLTELFGEGLRQAKGAFLQFIATEGNIAVSAVGIDPNFPNQIYVTGTRPYAIVKTESGMLFTPIDNKALTQTMTLTKPIYIKDLLENTLMIKPKSFSRQVLKNIYNNQFQSLPGRGISGRGGSAADTTGTVSVDILSHVSELLKEVPEIGELVDLANTAGDLISKGTLALFGIHGPYKQISPEADLQLLPLNEYSLTDQLIWRVLDVNQTKGTTARGFDPKNYPFLTLPENHPFNIIQQQITAAHGH